MATDEFRIHLAEQIDFDDGIDRNDVVILLDYRGIVDVDGRVALDSGIVVNEVV